MKILKTACIQCASCIPYCPMQAIIRDDQSGYVIIDDDECVECGNCLRADVCPSGALQHEELNWPRLLRERFSNPVITHPETGIPGRGTEEMKTNDVTGKYTRDVFGMAIEMGRPGCGARFREVDKVTRAMAGHGVHFDPGNPVTRLMADTQTGILKKGILDEKVLSAIIGFTLPRKNISMVLATLKRIAGEIRTVFSLSVIYRTEGTDTDSLATLLEEAGFPPSPCGKTNVGLGRS